MGAFHGESRDAQTGKLMFERVVLILPPKCRMSKSFINGCRGKNGLDLERDRLLLSDIKSAPE